MNAQSRHPKPNRQGARPPSGELATAVKPRPADGALVAEGLMKSYGDRPALAPLDLVVPHRQRVAMVGHNGSGKTTFMRMAAGLLDPSGGSVYVGGHAAATPEARSSIAYLSDTPTFYDDLSVWEHLEYVARLHGVESWDQHGADLLGHLGIYERADDLPNTFSRGLRQKAAIALAFIRPFDVLLVDEPFVGLDATGKTALLELLDDAAGDGATLIVATHELGYVERVARLVALRDGEVVYDGAPAAADVAELVSPGG
jgi:ABC-type multidrug transport system ATPase subunit